MRNRPVSGMLAIIGIAVFGAIVLVLFYRAPRFADRAPDLAFGIPRRALRFISIDVRTLPGGIDAAIAQVSQIRPDFVLVQGIEAHDAPRVAGAIGANPEHGSAFYPAQNLNGSGSTWGNLIVSKHQLYEGRSMPNRGGSFGVWAIAVVDGVKFFVGSANFAEPDAPQKSDVHHEVQTLARAYENLSKPPIVIGVRGIALDGADVSVLNSAKLVGASGPIGAESIMIGSEWRIADVQSIAAGMVIVTMSSIGTTTTRAQ